MVSIEVKVEIYGKYKPDATQSILHEVNEADQHAKICLYYS